MGEGVSAAKPSCSTVSVQRCSRSLCARGPFDALVSVLCVVGRGRASWFLADEGLKLSACSLQPLHVLAWRVAAQLSLRLSSCMSLQAQQVDELQREKAKLEEATRHLQEQMERLTRSVHRCLLCMCARSIHRCLLCMCARSVHRCLLCMCGWAG